MTSEPSDRRARLRAETSLQGGQASAAGFALIAAVLCGCLIAAVAASVWMWGQAEDGQPMSIHGWIALGLGVTLTLGLGVGLMALTFHSSRSGHDDEAADSSTLGDR